MGVQFEGRIVKNNIRHASQGARTGLKGVESTRPHHIDISFTVLYTCHIFPSYCAGAYGVWKSELRYF
jgi:hypothetical protein